MPTTIEETVRHLWVLRHGKAAPDPPSGGSDGERPLTARGRRDASALGQRMAGDSPVLGLEGVRPPDLAICSAAVRTRQTTGLVVEALPNPVPLESNRSLYGADVRLVLRQLREIDSEVKSVLLVGHNPTMFELVWELLAGGNGESTHGGRPDGGSGTGVSAGPGLPEGDRARLGAHGFPTCALAVLALPVRAWEELEPERASLEGLFKPPY